MITVKVYPVDSVHGFIVWLIGVWTKRVHWGLIHWTITVSLSDGTEIEYHLTGNGVSTQPQRSQPTHTWTLPYSDEETIQVLERISYVTESRVICSYQSMMGAFVTPSKPRLDTCISFVVYSIVGKPSELSNFPVHIKEWLDMYESASI